MEVRTAFAWAGGFQEEFKLMVQCHLSCICSGVITPFCTSLFICLTSFWPFPSPPLFSVPGMEDSARKKTHMVLLSWSLSSLGVKSNPLVTPSVYSYKCDKTCKNSCQAWPRSIREGFLEEEGTPALSSEGMMPSHASTGKRKERPFIPWLMACSEM